MVRGLKTLVVADSDLVYLNLFIASKKTDQRLMLLKNVFDSIVLVKNRKDVK